MEINDYGDRDSIATYSNYIKKTCNRSWRIHTEVVVGCRWVVWWVIRSSFAINRGTYYRTRKTLGSAPAFAPANWGWLQPNCVFIWLHACCMLNYCKWYLKFCMRLLIKCTQWYAQIQVPTWTPTNFDRKTFAGLPLTWLNGEQTVHPGQDQWGFISP